MKKFRVMALAFLTLFVFSAFELGAADRKKIVVGVAPGPYADLFRLGIKPALEKKGYVVDFREFSDYVQPNLALSNKSVDVNIFQHSTYLAKFSEDKGLKLSPVIKVPTASMALYSKKYKSIDNIKPGATITIPNDPSNLARALIFIQSLGFAKIKPNIDPTKASEKDITENPKKLVFQPVEAAQLPRTLDSVDFSTVPGNYAISSGIYSTALKREILVENYINVIAARTEDLNEKFVKDIKDIVESEEFIKVVDDPKNIFKDFQKPEWLEKKLGRK